MQKSWGKTARLLMLKLMMWHYLEMGQRRDW